MSLPPDEEGDNPSLFEEGGGPIKPFLDHLEDLRWTLIKSLAAVIVAVVVCLVAAKDIVRILQKPLHDSARLQIGSSQVISVKVGDSSHLIKVKTNDVLSPLVGTNHHVGFVLGFSQSGTNLNLTLVPDPKATQEPPLDSIVQLKNYSPTSPFGVVIKIGIFGGLGIASPMIFFFWAQFILPALRDKEKAFLYKAVAFGTILFAGGVVFCYMVVMPVTLAASHEVSKWLNFGGDEWRAEDYIGFLFKFLIGMGLAFELPILLLTLVKVGLLDYKKLAGFRMYWVVINLAISAIVTPSQDPLTLVIVALPLHVLYEVSIFIAWLWHRADLRKGKLSRS